MKPSILVELCAGNYDILDGFGINETYVLTLVAVYRFLAKNSQPFYGLLETILSKYPQNKKHIVLGDFNIDMLKTTSQQLMLINDKV